MRALAAILICLAVLVGSAVAVAANVDTRAATFRANAERLRLKLEAEGNDCGCTADIRAKDRVASRTTADGSSDK